MEDIYCMTEPSTMTSPSTAPLDRTFSLYLDLARFIAAALVVLIHLAHPALVTRATELAIPDLGREAVVLFFVLSGFVIAYTGAHRRQSARDYIVARSARIYSVALPVLLLAFPLAALAMYVTDFQPSGWYQLERSHFYLPFHLLFAGEWWTLSESPPSLSPYWSLNFEVWYYVLFGAATYLQGKRRLIVCGALLLLVGPKLWLLLPVWWSGVWLYRWQARHSINVAVARAGWTVSLLLFGLFAWFNVEAALRAFVQSNWPLDGLPLRSADRFLSDYLVCAIVLLNLACARYAKFSALQQLAAPIVRLSSHTFTLYLLHALVKDLWIAFYRPVPDRALDLGLLVLAIALSTYLLGFVTEKKKRQSQRACERIVDSVFAAVRRRTRPGLSRPADASVPASTAPHRWQAPWSASSLERRKTPRPG